MLYKTALGYGAQIYSHSKVAHFDPYKRVVTLASGQVFRADVIVGADGPWGMSRRMFLESEGKTDVNSGSSGLMMYK
jgi:salicylate hydroxylase